MLVAGDPERMHEQKVREDGGVWYHDNVITAMVSGMLTFQLAVVAPSYTQVICRPHPALSLAILDCSISSHRIPSLKD